MPRRRKKTRPHAPVFVVVLVVLAVVSAASAVFLWHTRLANEPGGMDTTDTKSTSPGLFSLTLATILDEVLVTCGVDTTAVSSRTPDGPQSTLLHVYTVKVPENVSLTLVNATLTAEVEQAGGRVMQGVESSQGRVVTLTIGTGDTPTDLVILRRTAGVVRSGAKMAVIIDDLGIRDLGSARRLCSIGVVLTLSVLPFQKHTHDVTALARQMGTPYMLHMPMEAKSREADPGEGALYVADGNDAIRDKLARAVKDVPGARGLNNHMGSLVTENVRSVETIMDYLREEGLFFVDSRTSLDTVAFSSAQKMGVRSAAMHGFIDAVNDPEVIERRLDELAAMALERGTVIIIGHDRPATVEILERKLPEFSRAGIQFVGVEELVY